MQVVAQWKGCIDIVKRGLDVSQAGRMVHDRCMTGVRERECSGRRLGPSPQLKNIKGKISFFSFLFSFASSPVAHFMA